MGTRLFKYFDSHRCWIKTMRCTVQILPKLGQKHARTHKAAATERDSDTRTCHFVYFV